MSSSIGQGVEGPATRKETRCPLPGAHGLAVPTAVTDVWDASAVGEKGWTATEDSVEED